MKVQNKSIKELLKEYFFKKYRLDVQKCENCEKKTSILYLDKENKKWLCFSCLEKLSTGSN